MSENRPKSECPMCQAPLDIIAAVGHDQRWSIKLVTKAPGGLLQAATIAGAISGAEKMMRATCKADGANIQTYVEKVSTEDDGSIRIDFISMEARKEKARSAIRKATEG